MSDLVHLVGTSAVAAAFGISEYEVRRVRDELAADVAAVVGKKFARGGVVKLAERVGASEADVARLLTELGFEAGAGAVKKDAAASPTPPTEVPAVDLMVARVCPNPTWVKAFAADAARDAAPVDVRVPNNRLLRPGEWLRGCKKTADGRFVWQGQKSVIFGRRLA